MSGAEREAMSEVVAFLEGTGPDRRGRLIETVLAFTPTELERHHNFIQWLFPLAEPSRAVPGSPVLTPVDIAAVRGSIPAQANLRRAAAMMADFYERSDHWLEPSDHNHLRITRIIRSLRLLAGPEPADAFRSRIERRVETAGAAIGERTRAFWTQA